MARAAEGARAHGEGDVTLERLLTARELADVLGFTAGAVLDQFERGDLPGFKLPNGAVRFRASEIEAWLDGCRRGPASPGAALASVGERS